MIGFANKETLRDLNFKTISPWLATWGGSGLLTPASGTWGTVGAMILGVPLLYYTGILGLLVAICILFPLGVWASNEYEKQTATKDSSHIVIDEVVGLFIALIPAVLTPASYLTAFLLFRFFDVIKPWPISYFDKRIGHGMGVMLDDVVAGIFAALVMIGLRYAGLY